MPFVDLSRVTNLVREAVLPAWKECLDKNEFVGGARVSALEAEVAKQMGSRFAVSCANGTDALQLALQAVGVKPGDHVALPNLTFWATFEAIVQVGAIPVLIDIDPNDLQMSFSEFRAAHEKYRFRTAILVHLYGWASAELAPFRKLCRERDIALVEDGAQCFGVRIGDAPVLQDAHIATLSFYPAKVIGGAMDGGAITTNEKALADLVRSLANHGRSQHYSYAHIGWNSRMGGLQAAFLLEVLKHSDNIVSDRARSAARYRNEIKIAGVQMVSPPNGISENGYLNVATHAELSGDIVQEKLKTSQIALGRTYPETMDEQLPAHGKFVSISELSKSRAFAKRVFNLPLFFGMREEELHEVIRAMAQLA